MKITHIVKQILSNYNGENPGVKARLCQILMHGKLGGTGKILILPVDQGFEHGPARSFAINPESYDPAYHYRLAIEANLSAYVAPLGFLEAAADEFAGQIPTILKLNNSNSLLPKLSPPNQAITSTVYDALRLGCAGVGITIYPGSSKSLHMMEEAREIVREAKSLGLAVIIWSYPRGSDISKEGENAIDICAYAAHMAALLGANIIKIKLPSEYIEQSEAKKVYEKQNIAIKTLKQRVMHVMQSCFNGKRLVVFSGGIAKSSIEILEEIAAINEGGGSGSIMGRNSFQRPKLEALRLLNDISEILSQS